MAHLILYDGPCGLCNRSIRLIFRLDRPARFRYAPLQGRTAAAMLRTHGRDPAVIDTMCVIADQGGTGERLLTRGRAAAFITRQLGPPWNLLEVLALLPARLLDGAYDLVARHRHRWFGRLDSCPLPAPARRKLFLD